MGACDISFKLDGDKTQSDVLKAFEKKQAEDREYNGHQEGYTGDFQTVNRVVFKTEKTFANYNDAYEFCLKNAEKWSTVVAVRYEVKEPFKVDGTLKRLQTKLHKLTAKRNEMIGAARPAREKLFQELKKKPFHTCKSCKSRVNTEYFLRAYCTVCNTDIIPAGLSKKFAKVDEQIEQVEKAIADHTASLKDKAKVKGTQWLVAGWGAC